MANFIRDIRTDLGAPGLPFVIATTGMDGGTSYTQVEYAHSSPWPMPPPIRSSPATWRWSTPGSPTTGWISGSRSRSRPADQGYHWNRNAKTYLHIGLAMGDAMSTLALSRCPSRLRATGGPGGVTLTWLNGLEAPDQRPGAPRLG